MGKATAVAHPNIAFVKFWGKADEALNLPVNPSLSMNLGGLTTVTTVEFRRSLSDDQVLIDGEYAEEKARARVVAHLDRVRSMAGISDRAQVHSQNDFPMGTGLASSASAFAALTLAATRAAGMVLNEAEMSRLARLGSGSACRSVPAGYVLWDGQEDLVSYGRQVAPPEHWDLRDVIAVVGQKRKQVGSEQGHRLAPGSPFYAARLSAVELLMETALTCIEQRDLAGLGRVMEADALAMHGVMMTSHPSLLYWLPGTVAVLRAVRQWRREGISIYFTIDAGPNVHCICEVGVVQDVERRLLGVPGVRDVLVSGPGGSARSVEFHLF
jgi:diphosphomevalonate decarboxylase